MAHGRAERRRTGPAIRNRILCCAIFRCQGAMDGYMPYFARALQPRTRQRNSIFLVAVTGFGQDDDRRQASEAGFDRHLSKPVVDTVLDAAMAAEALERRACRIPRSRRIRIDQPVGRARKGVRSSSRGFHRKSLPDSSSRLYQSRAAAQLLPTASTVRRRCARGCRYRPTLGNPPNPRGRVEYTGLEPRYVLLARIGRQTLRGRI